MSEFQTCEYGIPIDSVSECHQHPDGTPGTQAIYLQDEEDTIINLSMCGALAMFEHWTPTTDDLQTLPRKFATAPGPWQPQSFYNGQPTIPTINDSYEYFSTYDASTMLAFMNTQEKLSDKNSETNHIQEPTIAVTHDPAYLALLQLVPSELPNEPFFLDAYQTDVELDHAQDSNSYADPSAYFDTKHQLCRAFHLSIDYTQYLRNSTVDQFPNQLDDHDLLGHNEPMDTLAFAITAHALLADAEHLQPFLAWCPLEVVCHTLKNTTQLARLCIQQPMRDHIKPWFPWLNHPHLHETVATDTMFSSVKGIGGHTCTQVYWGFTSHFINVYGMKSKSEGPITLDDFERKEGIPLVMHSNNLRMQRWGTGWLTWLHA